MSNTIFMIHGMMGGAWCWDNYKAFFAEKGYHCVTPVLRYHDMQSNEAPDPRLATTGLLDYAADLEREIKNLGTTPILMGHSMGGLLAQILGSRGLAKSIILLAPAAPAGIWALNFSVIKSFLGILKRLNFWKKSFRISFPGAVYAMMHLVPINERKQLYNKLVYESGLAAFQIGFWFIDPSKSAKVCENNIQCPVLVIAGKEDRITPAPIVKKVADKYKAVSV